MQTPVLPGIGDMPSKAEMAAHATKVVKLFLPGCHDPTHDPNPGHLRGYDIEIGLGLVKQQQKTYQIHAVSAGLNII